MIVDRRSGTLLQGRVGLAGLAGTRLSQLHDVVHVDTSLDPQDPVGRFPDVLVGESSRPETATSSVAASAAQSFSGFDAKYSDSPPTEASGGFMSPPTKRLV